MKKTMIYLEDEQYERLKREASSSKKGMAAIVREAISEYFAGKKKKINYDIIIGIAEGPENGKTSEEAEEILREEFK